MTPDARVFFWWWVCERGCSVYTEAPTPLLPPGWETWRCRYDGSALRAIHPKNVTAEPPG